jgi:hypothetical protein
VTRLSRVCVVIATWMFVTACGDASGDDDDTSAETSTGGEADSSEGADTSSSSTGAVVEVDYETQIQPIWNGQCTCHLQGPSGTMTAPTLTLNPDISHGQLVSTPSTAVPTMARIEPGDPDASYLWHKTHATHLEVGGDGTEMPPGLVLSASDMQLVEDWIVGGALP